MREVLAWNVTNLVYNIQLENSFSNCRNCSKRSSKWKFQWHHLHFKAFLFYSLPGAIWTKHISISACWQPSKQSDSDRSTVIRITRQFTLRSHSKDRVLIITTISDISVVASRIFEGVRQSVLTVQSVTDVHFWLLFHVLTVIFSGKVVRQPKYIIEAYATGSPTSVMTASFSLFHQSQIGNSKFWDQATRTNENYTFCSGKPL